MIIPSKSKVLPIGTKKKGVKERDEGFPQEFPEIHTNRTGTINVETMKKRHLRGCDATTMS
jgi:hypothetical protein